MELFHQRDPHRQLEKPNYLFYEDLFSKLIFESYKNKHV